MDINNISALSDDDVRYILENYTIEELNNSNFISKLLDCNPAYSKQISEIVGFPKFKYSRYMVDVDTNYFYILQHKSALVERDMANVFYNVLAYIKENLGKYWNKSIIRSVLEYYHTPKSELVVCIIGLILHFEPDLVKLIPGNVSKKCFPIPKDRVLLPDRHKKVLAKGAI